MVQLVVSDIDGTLLLDGETAINGEIFRHIARLKEKGILFCPASGRQYSSLRRLFAPVADQLYYLCENGAAIFGPGTPGPLLSSTAMDETLALELCRAILEIPSCEVLISGADTSYLCPKEVDMVTLMRDFVGNRVKILASPQEMPEPFLKVSAYCRDGAKQVEERLGPFWNSYFHGAIAGEKWLDFTLADKGTGLRQLCRLLRIPVQNVVAFGDNYNDLPMLELAGTAYCMDGAAPELKKRIPRLCRHVEDVLAKL